MADVTLAEGPRMVTNIVDCDLDKLKVEQAVKVVFKPTDGGPPLPMFTPVCSRRGPAGRKPARRARRARGASIPSGRAALSSFAPRARRLHSQRTSRRRHAG